MKITPSLLHNLFGALITACVFSTTSQAAVIYIDFGNNTTQMASPNSGTYWNNVTNLLASTGGGGVVGNNIALVTDDDAASGITLTVTDLFQNENPNGTTSPSTGVAAFNFANLGRDSLFIDNTNPTAGFTFTGLDAGYTYTFTIFASRVGSITDNRSADYTFTGLSSQTVSLNASENTSNTVSTIALSPNGSNTISFSMAKSSTNTNGSGFAYLGGIQITATAVPEPGTAALFLGGAALLFVSKARKSRRI